MKTRQEAINFCNGLSETYEDQPFHDPNWTVIRHKGNNKIFAWIFQREGFVWINVKCDREWRDFWRSAYESVVPGFHLNKEHWNSIILDETIPEKDIKRMIEESYDLTKPKATTRRKKN
jgi:predicted DNA-binding protein (MmcQ/YjbR family)